MKSRADSPARWEGLPIATRRALSVVVLMIDHETGIEDQSTASPSGLDCPSVGSRGIGGTDRTER